ncbi:MAG: PEP-CTERM sorting domain-containing protein [Akkermansiaceae bacterium]|nr:PEP-CTERM sorting domain-containing protein [Akkermansiaceae bacterium]
MLGNGEVVPGTLIPEATSILLTALAAGGLVIRRRR